MRNIETPISYRARFEGYARSHLSYMTPEEQEALYLRITPSYLQNQTEAAVSAVIMENAGIIDLQSPTNGEILGRIAVS